MLCTYSTPHLSECVVFCVCNIQGAPAAAVGQALRPVEGRGVKGAVPQRRSIAAYLVSVPPSQIAGDDPVICCGLKKSVRCSNEIVTKL